MRVRFPRMWLLAATLAASGVLFAGCGPKDPEASAACKDSRNGKQCGRCCKGEGVNGSSWSAFGGCSCFK